MKAKHYQGLLAADLTDLYLYGSEDPGFRGVAECRDGEFDNDTNEANVVRIRDTWNACHGLDLPENVEPGILKEVVEALRHALPLLDDAASDAQYTVEEFAASDRPERLREAARTAHASLKAQAEEARELITKLWAGR